MAANWANQQRREEFLETQKFFLTNALKIIDLMVGWCNKTPGSKHLVDEMLHSIFFLGRINTVPFAPEEIIPNEDIRDALQMTYRRAFDCYQTQLPRRSPFSFVLDMIVLMKRPENENLIKDSLEAELRRLQPDFLVSSTLCVSESNTSGKHYGVSMSTTGPNPGQVVIAASCLSLWDDYVADAVMTYYPERGHERDKRKKSYFDGTFTLPEDVPCQAYNIRNMQTMHPCRSCGNLFGLYTNETRVWPYGNCAEVESLSNLFKSDVDVKNRAQPTSETWNQENRERARNSVLDKLRQVLKMIHFNQWDGQFYVAQ